MLQQQEPRDWLSGNFLNHDISCDSVWSDSPVVAFHLQEILVYRSLHRSLHQDSQNAFLLLQQNSAQFPSGTLRVAPLRFSCTKKCALWYWLTTCTPAHVSTHHMQIYKQVSKHIQIHCYPNRIETKVKKQRHICNKRIRVFVCGYMFKFVMFGYVDKHPGGSETACVFF